MAAVAVAPIAFAAVLIVQLAAIRLERPVASYLAIFFCIAAALTIQAGCWLSLDRRRAELILHVCAVGCVIGGIISSGMAWMQAFGLERYLAPWVVALPFEEGRRPFANLLQANHLATLAALAVASALYLWCGRLIGRATLGASLVVLSIGIALTVSRTPILQAVVVGAGAAATALSATRGRPGRADWVRAAVLGALPLLVLIAAMALVSLLNQSLELHLASTTERLARELHVSPRLALWRYALEIAREHPLLGVGWGEYMRAQYLIADRLGPVVVADNAHNIVLDLLAKTGIAGALAVLVPCVLWAWRCAQAVRAGREASQRIYCLTMVTVVAVHAMLEFPQTYAFFLLPVCLLLGMAETSVWQSASGRLLSVLSLFSLGGVLFGLVAGGFDYQNARAVYEGQAARNYTLNPSLIFGDWGQRGLVGGIPLTTDMLREKIALHESALDVAASPKYIRRYTVLLALDRRPEEALLQVKRLRNLSGTEFDAHYAWLIAMCDNQKSLLSGFKSQLLSLYGEPKVHAEVVAAGS